MKEKHTVHRLADLVISTKREGYVTNTTTRQTSGALDFDLTHRFDEVEGVRIVLFNPCRYSKDVGIEDDIAGRNTNFLCKDIKGALTDADLVVPGSGLPLLVKRHDNHRGAIRRDSSRLLLKLLLTFLETDRVDDPLSLNALKPRFQYGPLRTINHDRDTRDVGLARYKIEEARHARLTVEQPFVEVNINNIRAVLDLLSSYRERALEVVILDQLSKFWRTSHVCSFSNEQKRVLFGDNQGFQA